MLTSAVRHTDIQTKGLVLMEVMIAMVLVAVGLACLIRLHMANMAWLIRLEQAMQATAVAMDRISEARATGLDGPREGHVVINGTRYEWYMDLEDIELLVQQDTDGLKAIRVTVGLEGRASAIVNISSALYRRIGP